MSGSDPSPEITELAENLFGTDQYIEVKYNTVIIFYPIQLNNF